MPPKSQRFSQPVPPARVIPTPLSDYILIGIALLCVLLYALLLLAQPITLYLLALLPVLWSIYWIKKGRLSFSTPLDLPILGLLTIASLGALFSSYPDLFLPKLSGLFIGGSVYYLIVNYVRFRQRLNLVIFALIFLSLAIAFLALIGTDYPIGNNALFDRVYQHIPNLSRLLGGEKINKNTIGGALAFFPPLLLSLLWDQGAFSRNKLHYPRLSMLPDFIYKALVLVTLFLVLLALLLTQSRGAWLGCAAGVLLTLILKNKRFLWLLPLFLALLLLVLFWRADGSLVRLLSLLDTSQEATLPGRLEIWQRSFIILRDFSLTGIGLGAYGVLYQQYFASILFPSVKDVVFHAHNTFLSIAVEVGLPGLILYAALLGDLGAMSWHTLKTKRSLNRAIAIGLTGGLSAFVVFGLLDAFTLGRNLEVIFWIYLGLMSALTLHERSLSASEISFEASQNEEGSKNQNRDLPQMPKKNILVFMVLWLIFALFSLSWVNLNALLAFIIALFSGLALGVYLETQTKRIHILE